MKQNTLFGIQYLRSFAIIIVVIYHTTIYTTRYNQEISFQVPHEFGILGVMLFFVISGFIMSYLLDKKEDFFLLRRLLRIYPTYILITMSVIFFKVLLFGSVEENSLFYAMTLLPLPHMTNPESSYPLAIEWSLVYEIFFYIVCSFLSVRFLTENMRAIIVFVWMLVIIYFNLHYYEVSSLRMSYDKIFLSIFNLAFIIGFLSYYIYKRISIRVNFNVVFVILLTFLIFGLNYYLFTIIKLGTFKIILVSLLNAIMILLLLITDKSFKNLNTLMNVGDNSYAIYLLHVQIIICFLTILHKANFIIDDWIYCATLVLIFGIGSIAGKLDMYIHKYFRNKINLIGEKK